MECPECKKYSSKEDVCTNCGLVFEDRPIDYKDWNRKKDNNESATDRIYRSALLSSLENSTKVNPRECRNKDLKRALKKIYKSWKVKRENIIKKEIKRIGDLLGMSKNFLISCMYLYNKIVKFDDSTNTNVFRGGGSISLEIIAQAIVYLEIKLKKLPFTLYDLDKIGCERKPVSKFYRKLIELMGFEVSLPNYKIFLPKIINNLDLNEEQKVRLLIDCSEMTEKINDKCKFKNPVTVAGACVYIIGKRHHITQKNVCDIIGCDHNTLRRRINEISNNNKSDT